MPPFDSIDPQLAVSASLWAAVPAAPRPPGPDDCAQPSGTTAGDHAERRARPRDCSVSPGRTTTCSGPRPAHEDCGWKRDERVAPRTGLRTRWRTWPGSWERQAEAAPAKANAARLPPFRNLLGLHAPGSVILAGAPARSRHPFRADSLVELAIGQLRERPLRRKRLRGCGRLVQGARRSLASAVSPRSRCVRGRHAGSSYPAEPDARAPPNDCPRELGLDFFGLLMEDG